MHALCKDRRLGGRDRTLPGELSKLGLDVRVMLPLHSQIKRKYVGELRHICNFYVHLGWRTQYVGVESIKIGDIVYYFIDNEYYFGGPIYKGGNAEGEQYAYFCRAALEALAPDRFCSGYHPLQRLAHGGDPCSPAHPVSGSAPGKLQNAVYYP